MKTIITAIAIIAGGITLANADTAGSIKAEVDRHVAEAKHHRAEMKRHLEELKRHRAEAVLRIAAHDRLLAEIEQDRLTRIDRDRFTAVGRNTSDRLLATHNRHTAEMRRHFSEMERHLAEYKHPRDEALRHTAEAKRLAKAVSTTRR